MKAELEILKIKAYDIITASDEGGDCQFEDCPTREWDEFSNE